jgi:flagellar biosynthesis protein FlhF
MDMPEALAKIRAELGPNAVIISSRKIKKSAGAFGMLSRPLIEVTAAADIDPPASAPASAFQSPHTGRRPDSTAYPEYSGDAERATVRTQGMLLSIQAEIDGLREEMALIGRKSFKRESVPLDRGLKSLEKKLDKLIEQTSSFESVKLKPALSLLYRHLEGLDLEPALNARIFSYLQEKCDKGAIGEGDEALALRELISQTVKVVGDTDSGPDTTPGSGTDTIPGGKNRRVWAFVGPTGVGKTTTVAKLAARFALQGQLRVGLITVDTFRIAAVEQLRTYARIMDVPVRVALSAEDFKRAVDEFSDRDLILVDTAGQSPRDEQALGELMALFPEEVETEVHLVLSVTTRTRDLEDILRHYQPVKVGRLVLTKLDETRCHGPILHLPLVSKLPLSYLTIGQNVPDDIEPVGPDTVAHYLLGGLDSSS